MQGCGNCLKTKPLKNSDKFARLCTEFNDLIFVFSYGCSCKYGRWAPADSNPFFDFGPNLTGLNWRDFWGLVEQEWAEHEKKLLYYDPDNCPDMNELGCTFPFCDNCEVVDDEEEGWD